MAEFLFKLSALDLDADRIARRTTRATSRGDGGRATLALAQGDDEASLVVTLPDPAPREGFEISLPLSSEDIAKIYAAIKAHRGQFEAPAPGAKIAHVDPRRACADAAADAHAAGSLAVPQDYNTFRAGFLAGVAWQEGVDAPASAPVDPICAAVDLAWPDAPADAPARSGGGAVLVVVIGAALTLGALIGAALT